MAGNPKERVVNVVQNAAGKGLKEDLELEAISRGLKIRPFVGEIYTFAVNNKNQFRGAVENPRPKGGSHIGAVTPAIVADKLKDWAKDKNTSRGLLCCFILEMAIQKKLMDKIFNNGI